MLFKSLIATALATGAIAQSSSSNASLCDKYTSALLTNNTAKNQYTVLTLLVNTAVVGNFSAAATVKTANPVQGILNSSGIYRTPNGTNIPINLLPYFDGGLASSNRNNAPAAVNFVSGGGAAALEMGMPAFSNSTNSAQYTLLTHLYSFFGALLGCSGYGSADFPAYQGYNSQYSVHKYMDLNAYQVGYFIQEVGAAALSFGVTSDDVTTVAGLLEKTFNYKCSAPAVVIPSTPANLQAICIDPSCPLAANATCGMYDAVLEPNVANASLAMGEGNQATSTTITLAASGASTGTNGGAFGAATSAAKTASGSAGAASGTSSSSGPAAHYTPAILGVMAGAAALVYGAM